MSRRATSPAVGVVLLVVLTVALAGTVAAVGIDAGTPARPASTVALSVGVDAGAGTVTLRHRGGATLDAREIRVVVRVNGTRLRHQPPVPFFAARGFRGGPTGPFNAAAAPEWTAGETASLRVASTNSPTIGPGARVTVSVYADGRPVARLDAVA